MPRLVYSTRVRLELAIFLKGGRVYFGSPFAGVSWWWELEEAAGHVCEQPGSREMNAGAQLTSSVFFNKSRTPTPSTIASKFLYMSSFLKEL